MLFLMPAAPGSVLPPVHFWDEVPLAVLLLDGKFDASITDDVEFAPACEAGVEYFVSELRCRQTKGEPITWSCHEVLTEVCRDMNPVFADEEDNPLALRVGLVLGWLSGLAVCQPSEAQAGLHLLRFLVASEVQPGYVGKTYPAC